jgi:hypothetical protein
MCSMTPKYMTHDACARDGSCYNENMTNTPAGPGSAQWYADRHSISCTMAQEISRDLEDIQPGSKDYYLMFNAMTSANQVARNLYEMFLLSIERDEVARALAVSLEDATDTQQHDGQSGDDNKMAEAKTPDDDNWAIYDSETGEQVSERMSNAEARCWLEDAQEAGDTRSLHIGWAGGVPQKQHDM